MRGQSCYQERPAEAFARRGIATTNLEPTGGVKRIDSNNWSSMSFFSKLIGKNEPLKPRLRVCVECGLPVAEHEDWCSILRRQIEMKQARQARSTAKS